MPSGLEQRNALGVIIGFDSRYTHQRGGYRSIFVLLFLWLEELIADSEIDITTWPAWWMWDKPPIYCSTFPPFYTFELCMQSYLVSMSARLQLRSWTMFRLSSIYCSVKRSLDSKPCQLSPCFCHLDGFLRISMSTSPITFHFHFEETMPQVCLRGSGYLWLRDARQNLMCPCERSSPFFNPSNPLPDMQDQ